MPAMHARVSRHVLPHSARLRRRNDLGPAGVVVALGVLFAVLAADHALAHANTPSALKVVETPDLDVVLTVDAKDAPTFQVFQVPGHKSFVVELPGLALDKVGLQKTGQNILLDDAHVEPAKKGGPGRIVLAFADEVDYDAGTKGNELFITFKHAGDKRALLQAHQKKLAELEQKRLAALDEQRRAEAAAQAKAAADAAAEAAKQAALEKQRQEEEARKAAALEAQKQAEAARVAALEKKRQEEAAKKAAALEAQKQAEAARLAALEKKRQEEAAKKAAALEAQKQAEAARLAALEKKRQEEAAKKAALEKKRQEEEAARQAAFEKKRQEEEARKAAALEAQKQAEAARLAALEKKKQEEEARKAALEKKRQEEEAARQAALEKKRQEAEAAQKAALEQQRQEEARKAEEARVAAQRAAEEKARAEAEARAAEQRRLEEQRRLDARRAAEEQARRAAEEQARREAIERAKRPALPAGPASISTRRRPPADFGFGGKSIDLTPPVHYERYEPSTNSDAFGGDEEDAGLDETSGRSVLSLVTVQRTAHGSKVGVRVDGGAHYNVVRRGKDKLVLTLFDTRAANLDVRRILDASALDTTVMRVLPTVEEDARFRIELVIELREAAPVRIGQESGVLWLTVGDD